MRSYSLTLVDTSNKQVIKHYRSSVASVSIGRGSRRNEALSRELTSGEFRSDGTKVMSTRHAEIKFDQDREGVVWLMDVGSTNGTTVRRSGGGSIKLEADIPHRLLDGDTITFGRALPHGALSSQSGICEPLSVRVAIFEDPTTQWESMNVTPTPPLEQSTPLQHVKKTGSTPPSATYQSSFKRQEESKKTGKGYGLSMKDLIQLDEEDRSDDEAESKDSGEPEAPSPPARAKASFTKVAKRTPIILDDSSESDDDDSLPPLSIPARPRTTSSSQRPAIPSTLKSVPSPIQTITIDSSDAEMDSSPPPPLPPRRSVSSTVPVKDRQFLRSWQVDNGTDSDEDEPIPAFKLRKLKSGRKAVEEPEVESDEEEEKEEEVEVGTGAGSPKGVPVELGSDEGEEISRRCDCCGIDVEEEEEIPRGCDCCRDEVDMSEDDVDSGTSTFISTYQSNMKNARSILDKPSSVAQGASPAGEARPSRELVDSDSERDVESSLPPTVCGSSPFKPQSAFTVREMPLLAEVELALFDEDESGGNGQDEGEEVGPIVIEDDDDPTDEEEEEEGDEEDEEEDEEEDKEEEESEQEENEEDEVDEDGSKDRGNATPDLDVDDDLENDSHCRSVSRGNELDVAMQTQITQPDEEHILDWPREFEDEAGLDVFQKSSPPRSFDEDSRQDSGSFMAEDQSDSESSIGSSKLDRRSSPPTSPASVSVLEDKIKGSAVEVTTISDTNSTTSNEILSHAAVISQSPSSSPSSEIVACRKRSLPEEFNSCDPDVDSQSILAPTAEAPIRIAPLPKRRKFNQLGMYALVGAIGFVGGALSVFGGLDLLDAVLETTMEM